MRNCRAAASNWRSGRPRAKRTSRAAPSVFANLAFQAALIGQLPHRRSSLVQRAEQGHPLLTLAIYAMVLDRIVAQDDPRLHRQSGICRSAVATCSGVIPSTCMTFRPARHSAKYPSRGGSLFLRAPSRHLRHGAMASPRKNADADSDGESRHVIASEAKQSSAREARQTISAAFAAGSDWIASSHADRRFAPSRVLLAMTARGNCHRDVLDSIVKQPDASRSSDCASLHPGYSADTHHRPSFISGSGFAGRPCSFFPEGACGTTGRFTAPAAPAFDAGIPYAVAAAHGRWSNPTSKIVELNRASDADRRLRSARGWICRLAASLTGNCRLRRPRPDR